MFALVPSYSAPTQFLWLWACEDIFPWGEGRGPHWCFPTFTFLITFYLYLVLFVLNSKLCLIVLVSCFNLGRPIKFPGKHDLFLEKLGLGRVVPKSVFPTHIPTSLLDGLFFFLFSCNFQYKAASLLQCCQVFLIMIQVFFFRVFYKSHYWSHKIIKNAMRS